MRVFIIGISLLLNSADIQATLKLIGTNTPTIALSRVGDQVQIAYAGTLQLASALGGGWIDLTNAANPYIVDRSSAAKFFRARNVGGIFSSDEVVIFSMTGPLQEHFELAFAGLPDGIFPPVREKPWFEGTITIGQQSIPVEIRVRGNSSLQECPFPKLKFKVSRADRLGTPFYEAREVKIGTHCAEGGRGPIGRLRDERSAYREVLVYEMMQILEFLSPRVRRGRIEYQDTSTSRQNSEVGWSLMRNAMILDDVEVVAERLGGRALDDAEVAGLTNANFGLQLVTDLRVFQVLIGNWDYALTHDGVEVWNFDVVELPNLQLIPVAGDFDLSTFVTEEVNLDVPWDYHPELPPLERQARYDLEQINAGVSESGEGVFARAKERFESRRGLLEASIAEALIDEDGRTNAWTHLNAFYTALGAVSGTKGDQNTSRLQRVREGRVEVLP